jgi:hypothetical protein
MKTLTDVWTLESPTQEEASDELNMIIDRAFTFHGVSERNYLRKLWDGESWPSIKEKLMVEGSAWYVWYMDGVNAHIRNGLPFVMTNYIARD